MFELVSEFGRVLVYNMIQLIAGCILALVIYRYGKCKMENQISSYYKVFILIVISTISGMILPLDTYGLLMPAAALLAIGMNVETVLPMLFSNTIFNMLVPYTDVSFIWKTGIRRVILAFIAGLVIGVILMVLKLKKEKIFRGSFIEVKTTGFNVAVGFVGECISSVGLYLILGTIADTVFRKYAFFSIIDFIFTNSNTAFIPRMFAQYDITNPLFLLSKSIVIMLMDLVRLSALLILLKPKTLMSYYGYYLVLAALLSVSAFI